LNVSSPPLSREQRTPSLELWGGVECTVNRIGNHHRDQARETGHAARTDDMARIAELGFGAVRYPVLWECVSPDHPGERNWTCSDARLGRLHADGQRIIAGLVHHGSGPRYTDLLDPGFAAGLAEHARAVAERYPFIEDWTPVNEPVTTARFSALYGHWYPHRRDERAFWLALLNQIDATRLAMRAIRQRNPRARLIQTEDLGRTYATATLRDQAGFDNARRWMSWDLLCGLVRPGHDLWRRLCAFGFRGRLQAIASDPCPPDVIGINHYLTSDRFLDHRGAEVGPSEPLPYRDTEAIRVLNPPPQGLAGSIAEAWDRYALPIAVTEVHNGCTREEQMRWMSSAWTIAQQARAQGVDVCAVTSWALFGSSGWDTLLTAPGRYEPGAFDCSGGTPRPTALVPLLKALASGAVPDHPVLQGKGWWRRSIRLHQPAVPHAAPISEWWLSSAGPTSAAKPVLIAGGGGTLGRALAASCRHRGIAHASLSRAELDLLSDASICAALDRYQPWCVINAAGWVRVDDAERHETECFAINTHGAERLARACAERGIASVHLSSDLVFDGHAGRAYAEADTPAPLNAYGRSKAASEQAIAALGGAHLVVRTAAFFSPFDDSNFAVHACTALAHGHRFAASPDVVVSPAYVPDLCDAILDLAIDGERGVWHLTNGEACTWFDFAGMLARANGLDPALIEAASDEALGWVAPRPRHVPLISSRGRLMPSLSDAVARFARDWSAAPAISSFAAASSA
jgi:dTDP-4-dehydrorhamnose reductase